MERRKRSPNYTKPEIRLLKSFKRNPAGKTVEQLAQELNRPITGVKQKLSKIRINYQTKVPPQTRTGNPGAGHVINGESIVIITSAPSIEQASDGRYRFTFPLVK